MDVKSNSKIGKYRNHNSVVNRMTNTSMANAVTPVEPVTPISNSPELISYNSLLASDEFYDKLSGLQKEYKRFYHDQQELERALKDMSEDDESLSENMKVLVEKYNMAISSLKKFDIQFGTTHRKNVEKLLRKFKQNLLEIGVNITDDAILIFDENKFKESILESNDAIKFLFKPIKGLVISMHRTFRNIKIPEDENMYYDNSMLERSGMITDERI